VLQIEIILTHITGRLNKITHVVITQHDQLNPLQQKVVQQELAQPQVLKAIVVHQKVQVALREAPIVLLQEVAEVVHLAGLLPLAQAQEVVVEENKFSFFNITAPS